MNALKYRLAEGMTILRQSRALRDHKESCNGEGLWRARAILAEELCQDRGHPEEES